jgi:pimeloyl-ACP methyl ester carboxylesterase
VPARSRSANTGSAEPVADAVAVLEPLGVQAAHVIVHDWGAHIDGCWRRGIRPGSGR